MTERSTTIQRRTFAHRAAFALGTLFLLGMVTSPNLRLEAQVAAEKTRQNTKKNPAPPGQVGGLTATDNAELTERFNKELWPVMQRACQPCHGAKNSSQFAMASGGQASFLKLMSEGHFDPNNHASIIERVTTADKMIIMPPTSMTPLTRAEIALFAKFSEEVQMRQANGNGARPDEVFPAHLESAYTGKPGDKSAPNTFITYRQLRGKVKSIFGDDWKRGDAQSGIERDLFVENVHLFGGADFLRRFDETNKPSATFLTGMDMLGRDVASRAYLENAGPFAGLVPAIEKLPSSGTLTAPNAQYKKVINTLYNRMLFRDATPQEMNESFTFLQNVYRDRKSLPLTAPHDLRFDLTVRDTNGMRTAQGIRIAVTPDSHALTTAYIDQSKEFINGNERKSTGFLPQPVTFRPGDDGQRVVVTNHGSFGNVSVAGLVLRGPLPATTETVIAADDKSVRAEGAWRVNSEAGFPSFEDNNENKGASTVTFPVAVTAAGSYEVGLIWRRSAKPEAIAATAKEAKAPARRRRLPPPPSPNVRVEVVSADKLGRLALPELPTVPPRGTAEFFVDQTVDTLPYWDLRTAFRFEKRDDGIEIRTDGTQKRVVADAIRLFSPTTTAVSGADTEILLTASKATGKADWVRFQVGGFNPYNTIGPEILQDGPDGNKASALSLRYHPTGVERFESGKFYRVGLVYPGQVDNETRVPVRVYASASSPIVQVAYTPHAHIGSSVVIDASRSFNVQQTPLTYSWRQVGGPRVVLKNPNAPRLEFVVPSLSAQQASWEGLVRALMLHPDFLFTRPRSLAAVKDPKTLRRLQLVKIAQDLLARTPTPAEIAMTDKGTPLSIIVDSYLKSPEFDDYYYHRTRLYIESHGSDVQDEPARLWSYIARNNVPFQQILTADYTVDTNFQKKSRPSYHGKTGILTMAGFIEGKPGLPHFNYPAQVCEKFLGYVFEVPDEVLKIRDGITASATTDPQSVCYSCHKVLTPLAYQRTVWTDTGEFSRFDETGMHIDDSDREEVKSYPFKGNGMEAFALQAARKERFVRTMLQTHFVWYFGRELRYETDERALYRKLWGVAETNKFAIRPLIRAIVLSPQYLGGLAPTPESERLKQQQQRTNRVAKIARFHEQTVSGWKNVNTR